MPDAPSRGKRAGGKALSPTCPTASRRGGAQAPLARARDARADLGFAVGRRDADGRAQGVDPVGSLPGEVVVLAAEVAVGRGLLEDRAVEVEVATERGGAQIEDLLDGPDDFG